MPSSENASVIASPAEVTCRAVAVARSYSQACRSTPWPGNVVRICLPSGDRPRAVKPFASHSVPARRPWRSYQARSLSSTPPVRKVTMPLADALTFVWAVTPGSYQTSSAIGLGSPVNSRRRVSKGWATR